MSYAFSSIGGLLSATKTMNLSIKSPTLIVGSTSNIGLNLMLESPLVKIVDSRITVGFDAHFKTDHFICKNSIIEAKDIYLPAWEFVDSSNCQLIGNIHYQQ